jgi:hypothetical protein
MMIRQTSEGFVVQSDRGRNLSRPLESREAAVRRLIQIEHFKGRDQLHGWSNLHSQLKKRKQDGYE